MSNAIAVSIVPGELRLLSAKGNGVIEPVHQLSCALPPGAVQAGLRPSNLADPVAVVEGLRALAAEAGIRRESRGLVSVLVPDAAVRMVLLPLDGAEPSQSEGEAMARWALDDLLPFDVASARVDWSVVAEEPPGSDAGWLLVVGADPEVIAEYESAVQQLGWTAGRVVPLTLALAVGARDVAQVDAPGTARVVIGGFGGQVACIVEAAGLPRLHRAWRSAEPDLATELASLGRYADQRLERTIVEAVIAGPEPWRGRAADGCAALGWTVHTRSRWDAHMGAVQP